MIDNLGLIPTLEWYVKKFGDRHQSIEVEFQVTGRIRRLSPEMEVALYRVLQESLKNVAKHAKAHRVHLSLAYSDQQVALIIKDDGMGFDRKNDKAPDKDRRSGIGLLGMRERAHSLGGKFKIQSRKGKGTMVSVKLPI